MLSEGFPTSRLCRINAIQHINISLANVAGLLERQGGLT
jgi:hypothetical protein